MSLTRLQVASLRCVASAELDVHPDLNVVIGHNGAGKTSLLEAIYVLGRGRSFRAPQLGGLIATGQAEATIFAETAEPPGKLGLRITPGATEIRIDGQGGASVAELADRLPVQLIDPAVHSLVQGGPGERRRYLDWGVFHVKHQFLTGWRSFRRALQQRNAALKQGVDNDTLAAWDAELLDGAATVDRCRRGYVREIEPILQEYVAKFVDLPIKLRYRPGWPDTANLAEALAAGIDRDRALGATHAGPHRAELEIIVDAQPARHRLSRGQQKLLGAAMVLAQGECVQSATGKRPILLVDEPAAELDPAHLAGLVDGIVESGAQVFITALTDAALPVSDSHARFHVERGEVVALV
ncbi:MAG: DNA replication/repair protein RecF [Chromatiales bacterium]|nr:MAG: DNA replication/repair protein RecF [Chromatiales bacterium]